MEQEPAPNCRHPLRLKLPLIIGILQTAAVSLPEVDHVDVGLVHGPREQQVNGRLLTSG